MAKGLKLKVRKFLALIHTFVEVTAVKLAEEGVFPSILNKVKEKGILGTLLNTVKDFLYQRKQRVILNGQYSSWAAIEAGVPQGSILGPLLFLIYINNLSDDLASDAKLFADDTSLFSVVENMTKSANELNNDLIKISTWACQWKINFNPDPTKQAQGLIFGF